MKELKVVFTFSPEIETKMLMDPEGRPIGIEVTPLFFQRGSSAIVLYGKSVSHDGAEIRRAVVQMAGQTGALSVSDRTSPVEPLYYRQLRRASRRSPAPAKDDA